MPTRVLLPKIDNDATEARIARWFVKDDAAVAKGDLLFEIETDKAAVEVEAPIAGTIAGIVAPQGGSAPVGRPVAWIWEEGEVRGTAGAPDLAAETPSPAGPSRAASEDAPKLQAQPTPGVPAGPSGIARLVPATPLARRLARERGIDLKRLQGTGPRGRIQSADVPDGSSAPGVQHGGNLHCEWLRTGEGEPVVLVHGFGSELGIWRPLMSGLALSAPILAVDLPAHGKSTGFEIDGFDTMVDRVEETLRAEGLRRAHLVGHSLGGAAVAALAERNGIETRSLVLLSPAGLGPDINGAFLSGFCRARTEESLAPWMRLLVADPAQIAPAFVKAALRVRSSGRAAEALDRASEKLFPDGTQSFSIRSVFRQLSVPVKIIVGAEDRIIPVGHARGLPGHVAIHCFSDCGHMPHLEIRSEVGRLLAEAVRAADSP